MSPVSRQPDGWIVEAYGTNGWHLLWGMADHNRDDLWETARADGSLERMGGWRIRPVYIGDTPDPVGVADERELPPGFGIIDDEMLARWQGFIEDETEKLEVDEHGHPADMTYAAALQWLQDRITGTGPFALASRTGGSKS